MPTDVARRIVHYVDDFKMSDARLAQQLDCSVTDARAEYDTACGVVWNADVRKAMDELSRLAAERGLSIGELVEKYA